MIPNKLKRLWAEGKPTLNGWCSIGNAFTAEIMAAQGYDSITVDVQHGALDYSHLLPMLQAMRASGVVPMARVPWLEPGIIMKALDAGAYGIICPMVNDARQAAEFVSYIRYPPLGQRSFGPTRVSFASGADYGSHANDEMLALAMIETAEGMANLTVDRGDPRPRRPLCRARRSHTRPRAGPACAGLRPRGAGDDCGVKGDRGGLQG